MKFNKLKALAVPFAASAAIQPFLAYAAEAVSPEEIKTKATKLLEQGQYEQACELLNVDEKSAFNPQLTFLRGQCKFGQLDYSAAAFQYELMLSKNTNLPRVRLELARTLAAMGNTAAAKDEYEKVNEGKVPVTVKRNIQSQLDAIDEHRKLHGVFSLGLMHDSNVNAAPADPNIQAFGLPFVLDTDSTERSDMTMLGSFSAGRYFSGPFADDWRMDGYGNFLNYDTEGEFDSHFLGFSVGPNFYSNYRISLPLGYSSAWEGGKRASQTYSFSPSVSRSINQQLRVSSQLSFQHYDDLRETDESNGWSNGVSVNTQYSINQSNMVELGLSYLNNNANEVEYNRSESTTLNAGWHTMVMNGARFSLQGSISKLKYDAVDPVDMNTVRDDNRYGLNLNLYKDFKVGSTSFTPVLSIGWTKNESNIARRDYERTTISLQIRKQF